MKKINKTGQSFSADILVVMIIILFGTLFLVLNKINDVEDTNIEEKYEVATMESNLIYDSLKSTEVIDTQDNLDVSALLQMSDEELKEELGLSNDFAIVFEKDGKLVKIDPENNIDCIGSSKISVNGVACS